MGVEKTEYRIVNAQDLQKIVWPLCREVSSTAAENIATTVGQHKLLRGLVT